MILYHGHTIGKQIYHAERSNNISDRNVISGEQSQSRIEIENLEESAPKAVIPHTNDQTPVTKLGLSLNQHSRKLNQTHRAFDRESPLANPAHPNHKKA